IHVLAELPHREPREPAPRAPERDLRLRLSRRVERPLREREEPRAAHVDPPVVPTVTARKRAGDAPWPTCISCIGSPFPHVLTPQSFHSDGPAIASHPCQNRGVIPV